jgi:hypothetical protein
VVVVNRDVRSRSRLRQAGVLAAAGASIALVAAACTGSPQTAGTGSSRAVSTAQRIKVLTRALMLMQRDYRKLRDTPGPADVLDYQVDLGRELGQTPAQGHPPAGTGVLLTPGDSRADWLRAGQALHRMLVYAASNWVFASLYTQPLEAAAVRDLIRERLGLHGAPQIILQFGRADTTRATARRAVTDLMEP